MNNKQKIIAEKVLNSENEKLSGKNSNENFIIKIIVQLKNTIKSIWKKDSMSLVETEWLEKKLGKVKIIDCSWHMPQTERNGFNEYKINHIPNALFFDLDNNSKKDTDLPHMLVDINQWEKIVSEMGIEKNDEIVVYDNSDVISSCRCWFNFIYFGHDPKLVHVLNGGFKKWQKEKEKLQIK